MLIVCAGINGQALSKAKLKEQSVLVEHGLTELNNIKDTIDRAQTQIQRIENPIQSTSRILIEVNNLNKLLEREINIINQNASPQTRKDTKLIQIIARKLASVNSKLQESLGKVRQSKNEAKSIIEKALQSFNEK